MPTAPEPPEAETVQERAARGEPDAVARMGVLAQVEAPVPEARTLMGRPFARPEGADEKPDLRKPAAPNATQDGIVKKLVEVRRDLTRFPDSQRYVDARRHVEDALDLAVEALIEETD